MGRIIVAYSVKRRSWVGGDGTGMCHLRQCGLNSLCVFVGRSEAGTWGFANRDSVVLMLWNRSLALVAITSPPRISEP